MILPIDVKATVGFLHVLEGQDYTPIGTCFFLNLGDGNQVFSYIVTSKHVVDGPVELGQDIYLRVNHSSALTVEYVKLASHWVYHTDPQVDIAVSPRTSVPGSFPTSAAAIHTDWIVTRQRLLGPLIEGMEVFFMGMLAQNNGLKRNHPVMRQGHLALITGEPIEGYYGPAQYYLIECASYLGNSGSPLFMPAQAPDGRPSLALLGVLTGSYRQRLLTTHDDDSFLSHLDSGISLVTPAECILEVLRQDELVALRKQRLGASRLSRSQPSIRDN